jgi:[acyl-carrier-protein] S-malonyltransferase
LSAQPAGADFYQQHDTMRRWCDQVREWTGLEMPGILTVDYSPMLAQGGQGAPADTSVRPEWMYHSEVRQVAHAIGIADVLADQGIYPGLLVGSSIGGMTVACLAGCLEREELFGMLSYLATFPLSPAGEPARGIAYATLPVKTDIDQYIGDSRPHVYPIADADMGTYRVVMFSGYLEELKQLAAEAPPGQVQSVAGAMGGVHTPLEQFVRDRLEPYVSEINFRDPRIPLVSAIEGVRLETGEAVRRDLLESIVLPTRSLPDLVASLETNGAQLVLALGTGLPPIPLRSPLPVLQAAVPEDMGPIMSMLYDLGVDIGDELERDPATRGN